MRRRMAAWVCMLMLGAGAFSAPAMSAPRPVLMWTSDVHGGWDVVTLYSDGSISEPLNSLSTYGEYPTFSPDGKRVAYIGWTAVAGGYVPGGQIYIADLETGTQQLVYTPKGGAIYALEWSPRGDRIAFRLWPDKRGGDPRPNMDLWAITETEPGVWVDEPLITRPGNEDFPSWSPDGEYVIYGYDPDKNGVRDPGESHVATIVRSRVDGTDHRALVGMDRGGHMPVYSPDGKWIAYVQYDARGLEKVGSDSGPPRTDIDQIRLMRADGSRNRVIIDGRQNPWALDFSSDGRFLTWGEGVGWESTRILQLQLTRPGRASVVVDTPGVDHMPEYFPLP